MTAPMSVLDSFALHGRVALVTGGARGLGRALAEALASAGANVAVTSRDLATARHAAAAIAADYGGPTMGLQMDVRVPESIDAAVAELTGQWQRLDVLINNAGVTRRGALDQLTVADWDDVQATNLRGAWLCSRAVQPHMQARGWGRIVHVSSMLALVGLPDRAPYVASKGGLVALTRAMAVELAPYGITVNSLCPGPFQTDIADSAARAGMLAQVPLGRWGNPTELGPAGLFLASPASSYMTGSVLTVDGGYTAR